MLVDIVAGEIEDREPTPEEQGKDPAAVKRGRGAAFRTGAFRRFTPLAYRRGKGLRVRPDTHQNTGSEALAVSHMMEMQLTSTARDAKLRAAGVPSPRYAGRGLRRAAARLEHTHDRTAQRTAPQSRRADRLRALGCAQAHDRGRLRPRARARRARQRQVSFLGPRLSRPQGRQGLPRRRDLAHDGAAHQAQARSRARSGGHRPHHHLSRPVEIPDRDRDARARGARRADGAGRGAQEEARRRRPVRSRAQAVAAVPADGDRRHHLADRRGDPRHPAPALRPLSAARARLAREGAGRRLRRAGCRCDPRLQRALSADAFRNPIS